MSGMCVAAVLVISVILDLFLSLPHQPVSFSQCCCPFIGVAWQWWEGELERAYVLHKTRRLLEVSTTWPVPGARVPIYLKARTEGNKRVPQVHLRPVALRLTRGTAKKLQEQGEEEPGEGEKEATLKFVMHDLAFELYNELAAGFH